jgi:hypothetical protein
VVELPSVKSPRWYFRLWVHEVVAAILAGAAGVFEVILYRDPAQGYLPVAGVLLCTVLLLVNSVICAARSWSKEARFEPLEQPAPLVGWAKGTHAAICKTLNKTANEVGVRVAIHKVHWDKHHTNPTELEQIIECVGGFGGPIGRTISARSGIIGRAARAGEQFFAKRVSADMDGFISELVEVWSFTEKEAHDRAPDRWGWCAVPLLQPIGSKAYGVVFFDSKSADLFDDGEVRNVISGQCASLASICASTYNRD